MTAPSPVPVSVPARRLCAGDAEVQRAGRWAVGRFQALVNPPPDEPAGLGRPGLWNLAGSSDPTWVFAWPTAGLEALRAVTDSDPAERSVLSRYRSWMARTQPPSAASSWRAPSHAAVRAALAGERLVVRRGPCVRRIQPVVGAHRLALTCPVLPPVSVPIPEPRLRWMNRLRTAAIERHPCVRLEWVQTDQGRTLTAETDLSGAPAAWVDTLLVHALAEMRRGLEPLLEPLTVLTEATEQDLQFLAIPNHEERHDASDKTTA